jgi:hypothetical protein
VPGFLRRLKPYGLLFLLSLPALWASGGAGIPRTNDNLTHFYRTVELDQLVRAGILFPRWAPHLVFNFGYPIFDFFPYEAHLLVEGLHLLGLSFLSAYNLAGALVLLASAVFAFQLGREHFGARAGLVAGVAYLYSPYILYDTYIRGALPESLALALLPLVLLLLRRAVRGNRAAVAWASLAMAADLFAHHGVMLQAMPFVGLYAFWESGSLRSAVSHWKTSRPARRLQLLIANYQLLITPFVLGLCLTAFFYLPALTEARYVQTERGTGNGPMNYPNNFLGLDQLFALPRLPVDPDLLNPPVVHSLPLAGLLLAGLALARWAWPRTRPRAAPDQAWSILFLAAAALVAALLIHPIARPLWDALPLLQLTLFPWRLLGPISLFVALLAGALFAESARPPDEARSSLSYTLSPLSFVLLCGALLFLIAAGLPFATPPREPVPADATLADLAGFEVPPDFIGTTTVGEYLPIWVHQLPNVDDDRQRLMKNQTVPRYSAPGATVAPGPARPIGATFSVQAAQALTFVYRTFYFPGWRATLDGRPAPITITSPEGLMAVAVPPGAHTLAFDFGLTLPRILGDGLSILGLLAFAAWLAWPRLARVGNLTPPAPLPLREGGSTAPLPPGGMAQPAALPQGTPSLKGRGWGLGLFVFAALIALARPLLYDAGRTPLLRYGLATQPPLVAAQPLEATFSGELHLLGADLPTRPVPADAPLNLTLYWQADHRLGVDYGFQVQLVDGAGHAWTERGYSRPADWRFTPGTDFWPPNQYILDPYVLSLLPGTPPGVYTVQATVFARYNQQSIGTQPVGTITVGSPARSRTCPDSLGASPASALRLRQAAISPAAAAPGDEVTVSLCWGALSAPGADLRAQLRLADANGMLLAAQSFRLGNAYPSSLWQPGDMLLDQVTVLMPAALATGNYAWSVSVADGTPVPLGLEAITAPARVFAAPPVDTRLEAGLGPITLYGLSGLPPSLRPGADLNLTLAWRADATLSQSYNVFVHLQAADGSLVAQSDGVPANWTRRTTGWLPGEFVLDPRSLHLPPDLPAGQYSLSAGLYRPDTGQRLTTAAFPDGQVALGVVTINP